MKPSRILFPALLLFLLVLTPPAYAQAPGGPPPARGAFAGNGQGLQVSGTVVEQDTGKPIPSATVAVWYAADSTLAAGAITDEKGAFAIAGLRPDRYYLKVSFVGFKTQTIADVAAAGQAATRDLGEIRLTYDLNQLDEVSVTGERSFMEVSIDRTVYNVRDQLVSVGGNGLDVLRNIPSIEVDIDNNISLRGSANVAILINGRPSPMSGDALTAFLQGLSSQTIDRVEVIPNPSAKYEPDGMAGILNIVLKQDKSTRASGSLTADADSRQNVGVSGNVSYQKGKIGVYAGYGFRDGQRNMEAWRYQENRISQPLSLLDETSDDKHGMFAHNLNLSLDYTLDPRNSITFSTLLNQHTGDENGLTSVSMQTDTGSLTDRTERRNLTDEGDRGVDLRAAFNHVVEASKNEFRAEVRFETESQEESGTYETLAYTLSDNPVASLAQRQLSDLAERNMGVSLQMDYIRPIGGSGRFEAGYKGDLQQIRSDIDTQTLQLEPGAVLPDFLLSDAFDYDQTINAAYGILAGEIGRFGLQAGVRAEQASRTFLLVSTDESYDKSYFSLFPSAFVTYELVEGRNLRMSYSKRINRPRSHGFFNMLNPISDIENPLFRRQGNPYLDPEYVHSFEVGYTHLAGNTSFTLTPYYRHTVDVIRQLETLDDQGVTWMTFRNFDTSDSWGIETIGTLRAGTWLNAFASVNAFRVVTDGSNVDSDLTSDAFGFGTRLNATFALPRGLDIQATVFYRAPMNIEGGRMSSRSMADIAIRQKFMNERASLSLRVSDVFGTMGMHMLRDTRQFYSVTDRTFDAQRVGLSLTYNFGQVARNNRRNQFNRPDQGGGMDDMPMDMD